jgi:RHS repeat-associated protein
LGNRTTSTFDAAGRQIRQTDALGNITTYLFDATNRTTGLINALGNRATTVYDTANRAVRVVNFIGKISTATYDAADRLLASITPLGLRASSAYDSAGQGIRIVDANGNVTTSLYDAAGRVQVSIDAKRNRTTQVFDAVGKIISWVDANGNRTTFSYDKTGNKVRFTDALGRVTTAGYDAAGRQTQKIDARGNRITYVYDDADRLTTRRYPDGSRVTFSYDAVNEVIASLDSNGRTTSTYDAARRLQTVTNPAGKRITYVYNGVNLRTLLTEPGGGRFTYGYDSGLRLIQLINPESQRTSWGYDQLNRLASQRLANSTRASYTFDDGDRVTRLVNITSAGTTISSFGYLYDSANNRTRVIEANGDRITWTYDAIYQLIREARSGANGYTNTYSYDPVGNRLKKIQGGQITTFSYDAANQLMKEKLADGTITTIGYDANGNQLKTISSIVTTYAWDYENKLTKIRQGNVTPSIATMVYNPDGYRVRRDDSTGTVKFIWDLKNVLLETDQNDVTQAIYSLATADFGLLVSQRRGVTNYYHYQGVGSTDRLTDSTGSVTDQYILDGFGNAILTSGTTTNPFRFVGALGYYFDSTQVAYQLRNRFYSSSIGRFLSFDSIMVFPDLDLFQYSKNNPINRVDPLGNFDLVFGPVNYRGCGELKQTVLFRKPPAKEANGFVVHKVILAFAYQSCAAPIGKRSARCPICVEEWKAPVPGAFKLPPPPPGAPLPPPPSPTCTFWELFPYMDSLPFTGTPANFQPGPGVDDFIFFTDPKYGKTFGYYLLSGEYYFDKGIPLAQIAGGLVGLGPSLPNMLGFLGALGGLLAPSNGWSFWFGPGQVGHVTEVGVLATSCFPPKGLIRIATHGIFATWCCCDKCGWDICFQWENGKFERCAMKR